MTEISAPIIADSINPDGERITTHVLTYPLALVHNHLLTHRTFSRSTASQRAVPTARLAQRVIDDPALPVYWGKAQKGMGAAEQVHPTVRTHLADLWRHRAAVTASWAERDAGYGLAKELANRHMTAYEWATVILTGTDFANFFRLRVHPKAQAETRRAAYLMLKARVASVPVKVGWGGQHVPFGDRMPADLSPIDRAKVAVARCARVSYETHDGAIDVGADLDLYDRLIADGHMAPLEHVATAEPGRHANYSGWWSHRREVEKPAGPVDEAAFLAECETWMNKED